MFIVIVQDFYVFERHSFLKQKQFFSLWVWVRLHNTRNNVCVWVFLVCSPGFLLFPSLWGPFSLSFFLYAYRVLHDLSCERELSSWSYYPTQEWRKHKEEWVAGHLICLLTNQPPVKGERRFFPRLPGYREVSWVLIESLGYLKPGWVLTVGQGEGGVLGVCQGLGAPSPPMKDSVILFLYVLQNKTILNCNTSMRKFNNVLVFPVVTNSIPLW